MTAWATLLVPAGAVAVGGLITGGATIWAQKVTHRGTYQREREARRDAFQVKRFEIERDTLLELQDALNLDIRLLVSTDIDGYPTPPEISEAVAKVWLLHVRVLDDDVRELCGEYLHQHHVFVDAKRTATEEGASMSRDIFKPLSQAFRQAQAAIGQALRRDPFRGEGS